MAGPLSVRAEEKEGPPGRVFRLHSLVDGSSLLGPPVESVPGVTLSGFPALQQEMHEVDLVSPTNPDPVVFLTSEDLRLEALSG